MLILKQKIYIVLMLSSNGKYYEKKTKNSVLKIILMISIMTTIMVFLVTSSIDMHNKIEEDYWKQLEGIYEGEIIDIVTIDPGDHIWKIIILESNIEHSISPNNKPFFIIADNNKILFIDSGPLNGLSQYSLNDQIIINLNEELEELICKDTNNVCKFKKKGLPLLTTQFPKKKVRNLINKYGLIFRGSDIEFLK